MLKLVEGKGQELYNFCVRDSFGTKIAGYFKTYSNDFQFALFYIQTDENGKVTAAASKIYGSVVLSASEEANFEEIKEFLLVTGYSVLSCELSICEKLCLPVSRMGNIVEFNTNERDSFKSQIQKYPSLVQIYDLLSSVDFSSLGDKSEWVADIGMRMRKDVSLWSIVEDKGKIVACACALFITESAVFLGCVACDMQKRRVGLGSDTVLNLAQNIGKDKRVNLFCKDGDIVNFYKKLGFSVVGRWAESEYIG